MVTTSYLEHDTTVRGIKLHYQEWGEPGRPVIVMLHGFGVSGHMFDEFADRIQSHYHLIALDQRGHGDSDWAADGDYSRDAFVEDLEAFRAAIGLDRFILMGHSMGGLNAVSYTVAHGEHVRALVLVDVGPESAKEGVDNIVRFTRGPDELEFEEFVEMAHRFNPRRTMENIRERMRHRLKQMDNGKYTWKFDARFRQQDNGLRVGSQLSNDEMWQMFRQVAVPTLLVRGGESDVLSQEVAERAVREMQRTQLAVVPGAGHSVPGDNPADFTEAVENFLNAIEERQFTPAASTEPPPLTQLMEENAAARRRGPSMMTLVVAGLAAVLALAGIGYASRKASSRRKKRGVRSRAEDLARRVPPPAAGLSALSEFDMEAARRRAVGLVDDLSGVSRKGLTRARRSVRQVDVDSARQNAVELAKMLGATSREAPARVRDAASKIDTKKLKKRRARVARMAGRAVAASLVAGSVRRRKGGGGMRFWRS